MKKRNVKIIALLLVLALSAWGCASVFAAIICARVVLPTPGGPQKIMEDTLSRSIRLRSTFPSPTRCCCPTNSSKFLGLILAASG